MMHNTTETYHRKQSTNQPAKTSDWLLYYNTHIYHHGHTHLDRHAIQLDSESFLQCLTHQCYVLTHQSQQLPTHNVTSLLQVNKVKERIAVNGYSISQLWGVTCHIGSHTATCHPTQVNVPHLNPSQ